MNQFVNKFAFLWPWGARRFCGLIALLALVPVLVGLIAFYVSALLALFMPSQNQARKV